MKRFFVVAMVVIFSFASIGCAAMREQQNPLRFSFESLGADYESRIDGQGYDNRTSVNITGLSLPVSAGQSVTSPGGDLPDLLAIPVASQCSKYVVTKYDTDATYADVLSMKASLDAILEQSLLVSVSEIKVALAAIALERTKKVSPKEATDDEQLSAIAKTLGVSALDETSISTAKTTALAQKMNAQQQVNSSLAKVRGLSSKKNLFVVRWTGTTQASGGGAAGSIFSADANKGSKQVGFAVIAGIRDSSVMLGKDFITRVSVEKKQFEKGVAGKDIETVFGDPYVVLFTRAAKHIAYSEQIDLQAAMSAKINIKPEQLHALGGTGLLEVLKQQEVSLGLMVGAALAASNSGGLTEPQRELYEYRFWAREVRGKTIESELRRQQGYAIVYHNRSTVMQARKAIPSDASGFNDCMHVVPRDGSVATGGVETSGATYCLPLQSKDWSKKTWEEWEPDTKRCIDLRENLLAR